MTDEPAEQTCPHCDEPVGSRATYCMHCGRDGPRDQMEEVDISTPDEYYPEIRYLCGSCSKSDQDD